MNVFCFSLEKKKRDLGEKVGVFGRAFLSFILIEGVSSFLTID